MKDPWAILMEVAFTLKFRTKEVSAPGIGGSASEGRSLSSSCYGDVSQLLLLGRVSTLQTFHTKKRTAGYTPTDIKSFTNLLNGWRIYHFLSLLRYHLHTTKHAVYTFDEFW